MNYYEVLVSSPQYHGAEALTYESAENIAIGTVVSVPLRNKQQLAIVIGGVKKPSYKTKSIDVILTDRPLPQQTLNLLNWLSEYYPAPSGLIAQQALPSGLLMAKKPSQPEEPTANKTIPLPNLSPPQIKAIQQIQQHKSNTTLLHGDTGTGKTRMYMELTKDVLKQGKSSLILTPEIGLTPQLVQQFEQHFAVPVIVMHSQQTPAERRTQWLRILYANGPIIVIGPRSTLFTPIQNLGLIVVDEAHEQAYKQDQSPRYHALRVAGKLASLHSAKLVIGSATMPVSEYWLAEQKNVPIVRLDELPSGKKIERTIELVDLKDREQFSKSSNVSTPLYQAIENALQHKQQALVFLNRRGTARLIMCQLCGWNALCPNCDLPLTYHGDKHDMRCHTCGHTSPAPASCPECKSPEIIFKSIGTKSIANELKKLFPKANIKRFDTDNLTDERLEKHYDQLRDGTIDIIVGTQMIAKGLDLPKLSVVGVVIADTSLYLPDFSAEERTYQMLTQVIGRVGRGHNKGMVVIQAYQPDSPSMRAAIQQDWPAFYQSQLSERKNFSFPPYVHILQLSIARASATTAQKAAEQLADKIKQANHRVIITGPTPAFREKQHGKFHWQLVIKAKKRQELLDIIKELPAGWTHDIDPTTLL